MSNVVQLPRPMANRPSTLRLGHYLHVDWSDHLEVLQLIAEGERAYMGLVIGATSFGRHKELIKEAAKRGLDIILDPKTQQSAWPGSHTSAHAKLPWGLERPHQLLDFVGDQGSSVSARIASFAAENGASQVFAPTHLLASPSDPWFEVDIANARKIRRELPKEIRLNYPLSVPMTVFRDASAVRALTGRLSDLDIDAIWLRIENYGSDASGEKVVAYIEAARQFASLEVPVIADHVAGLPGLGLLAFGATGGIAHGVMAHEGFKVSSWRRPPADGRSGGTAPRVYVPALDMLLSKQKAQALFEHSVRSKGHFGCQDPSCCPKGIRDTLSNPARHYLRQRAREVEAISRVPSTVRVQDFLDKSVRKTSDAVAAAAGLNVADNELAVALAKRQKLTSRFRLALGALADRYDPPDHVVLPSARDDQK